MAIALKILGWTVEGLRCPDHTISFEKESRNGEVYKVALIQMPNGTGKTTTLKLLRAALAGPSIWNDDFEKVNQFRKSPDIPQGRFELRLLYNDRRLTITMLFDFSAEGDVSYSTTSKSTYGYGKDPGFNPPTELRLFLTPEFVKLLIFDGELAAQLLDSKYTNAQQAIEGVYQLFLFQKMEQQVENYYQKEIASINSSGGPKELTRRKNRVDKLKQRLENIEREQKADQSKLNKIKKTVQELEDEFEQEIEKDKDAKVELEKAKTNVEIAEQDLAIHTRELVELMKNPVELSPQFSNAVLSLKDSFDRVKLPGIAAREFFEEISDESHCICGREIDEGIKKVIRQGAERYLGSEEVAILNAMKSDIKDRVSPASGSISEQLSNVIKQVGKAENAVSQARQAVDLVKLKASDHDPNSKRIYENISRLQNQQGQLEEALSKYSSIADDSDNSQNPTILKKLLKKAEQEFADATGTANKKRKKDALQRILGKAFEYSKASLSERVCKEANKKIDTLLPHNHIRIDSINRSLKLEGKEGGSVGETLTVGYAFLSSLLSNAQHSLPSVVDSPSGPIDLAIRPEIGRLIPKLSDQFIAFVISSERQSFVNPLVKAVSEGILFATLFRKGNSQLEATVAESTVYEESDDCITVFGQPYFEKFHQDQE